MSPVRYNKSRASSEASQEIAARCDRLDNLRDCIGHAPGTCEQGRDRILCATAALSDVAEVSGKNRHIRDAKHGDCELDQNVRAVRTDRGDFDARSEDRTFAGLEIMLQPLPVAFARRRRNNKLGEFFPDRYVATLTENLCAAGLNSSTRPCESIVMIQSSADSRIAPFNASNHSALVLPAYRSPASPP